MQDAVFGIRQRPARAIMYGAMVSGRLSLLAIVIFIFGGAFDLVEMNWGLSGRLVWDALLLSVFFIQHSGMIRRNFRSWMGRRIPVCYHGALFTMASSLALALVVVFWQSSGQTLIELRGPLRWMTRAIFFIAGAGIGWTFLSLKGFDLYGIGPIKAQLSGKPLQTQPFSIQGPYGWVRHPLYFFVLVMVWSCPDLTADRLLFNLLWTGWVFGGTFLEERDLLFAFGDDYREYQRMVPMLIPWKRSTPMLHKPKISSDSQKEDEEGTTQHGLTGKCPRQSQRGPREV